MLLNWREKLLLESNMNSNMFSSIIRLENSSNKNVDLREFLICLSNNLVDFHLVVFKKMQKTNYINVYFIWLYVPIRSILNLTKNYTFKSISPTWNLKNLTVTYTCSMFCYQVSIGLFVCLQEISPSTMLVFYKWQVTSMRHQTQFFEVTKTKSLSSSKADLHVI